MKSVNFGCRVFYFGGFGEFDDLCYQIVTKLQNEQSSLKFKRIYCVTQEKYLKKASLHFKRENYEEIVYLSPAFEGWYKSIYFRNCFMIDNSDYVIFYAKNRDDSGAYKAYRYAKRKSKKVIVNLYPKTPR